MIRRTSTNVAGIALHPRAGHGSMGSRLPQRATPAVAQYAADCTPNIAGTGNNNNAIATGPKQAKKARTPRPRTLRRSFNAHSPGDQSMATQKSAEHQTQARAKALAGDGTAVRDRVRELSVGAFRDRNLTLSDLPKLVHEVLEGAAQAVDESIPKSSRSVLRGVFDGLSEGVHAIASAGSTSVSDIRGRAPAATGRNMSHAAARIRAANDEFLGAVKSFAGKTSKQVREELDTLVARAERTKPKVVESARKAARAADGRLIELSGETADAGVHVVRRAAGALAMGASGFLEGVARAITPKGRPTPETPAKKSTGRPPRTAKKKTAKKSSKKARPSKRRTT